MKILFLYSELAGYFFSCVEKYLELYGGEAHIVRWPLDKNAPFVFQSDREVTFYERSDYSTEDLLELYDKLKPDLLYVTGWIDKPYLKVAKKARKEGVPVICAMDNQWFGTFRQKIASALGRFVLLKSFSDVWVPGLYQYEYARRLGFSRDRVHTGMYCADTDKFLKAFQLYHADKEKKYPHQILYIGRFIELKGIRELIEAFKRTKEKLNHDWQLKLVGAGELKAEFEGIPDVLVKDFVQPEELPGLVKDAGALVLPSHRDAWGVVLHEFACAGLPLVISSAVGATTAFLRHGYNGFAHQPGNVDSVEKALTALIGQSDEELHVMGERSNALSQQISLEMWAATLERIGDSEI